MFGIQPVPQTPRAFPYSGNTYVRERDMPISAFHASLYHPPYYKARRRRRHIATPAGASSTRDGRESSNQLYALSHNGAFNKARSPHETPSFINPRQPSILTITIKNTYKVLKTVKICYKQLQKINNVQNPTFCNIFNDFITVSNSC